jgi:hypothetical protein
MTSIQALAMVLLGTNSSRRFLLSFVGLFLAIEMMALDLREGDLLFVCSDTENAITQVTSGVEDLPIDHVAIVHHIGGDDGPLYVIEAIKPVVCLTPIDTFLLENPLTLVGRVNADVDIHKSIGRCLKMVGRPYDDLYQQGDSALYCSELVQLNYVDSQGALVFEPIPMSFHDASGQVTDYWREFYDERGMAVPEGCPGSNPGELSRRPQITIITPRL